MVYLQNKWRTQDDAGSSHENDAACVSQAGKLPQTVPSMPLVGHCKGATDRTYQKLPRVVEDQLDQFILLRGGPASRDTLTAPMVDATVTSES